MSKKIREEKYQALRLYHSGKMSLGDIKAKFRVTATVTRNEYSSTKDQKDILGTQASLEKLTRLAMTRDIAKQRAIMRFKPKPKFTKTRNEAIAQFALGTEFALPHGWERYGNLVKRTKRVNPPRLGSSKGKIGKTRYIGFKKFNKDFDQFMRSLLKFTKDRKAGSRMAGQLKRFRDSVNITATTR
jgi:hypothetical protein